MRTSVAVALVLLVPFTPLAMGDGGSTADAGETPQTALAIGEGQHVGTMDNIDSADWYTFVPPPGSVVRFAITGDVFATVYDSTFMFRGFEAGSAVALPTGPFYIELIQLGSGPVTYSIDLVFEAHEHAAAYAIHATGARAIEVVASGFVHLDDLEGLEDRPFEEITLGAYDLTTPSLHESGVFSDLRVRGPLFDTQVMDVGVVTDGGGGGVLHYLFLEEQDGVILRLGIASPRTHDVIGYVAWDGDLTFTQLPASGTFLRWNDLEGGAFAASGPATASVARSASLTLDGATNLLYANTALVNPVAPPSLRLTSPSGDVTAAAGPHAIAPAEAGTWTLDVDHAIGIRGGYQVLGAASFGFAIDAP